MCNITEIFRNGFWKCFPNEKNRSERTKLKIIFIYFINGQNVTKNTKIQKQKKQKKPKLVRSKIAKKLIDRKGMITERYCK